MRQKIFIATLALAFVLALAWGVYQYKESRESKARLMALMTERRQGEAYRKQQLERELLWLEQQEQLLVGAMVQSMSADSLDHAINRLKHMLVGAQEAKDHARESQIIESLMALSSHHGDTTVLMGNYEALSWHLLETHQFLRAIKVARKALELEPNRLAVKKNLAIAYFMNQQFRHGEDLIANIRHHSLHGQPIHEVFLGELRKIAQQDSALLPIVDRAGLFLRKNGL